MNELQKINFFKFKKKMGVVEIFIDGKFESVKDKLGDFTIEDKSLSRDNWQVLYMEQYFDANRAAKLCETYEEPARDTSGFNLVFFIYGLAAGQTLCTPFGKITVTKLQKLPREYKKKLEFEPLD